MKQRNLFLIIVATIAISLTSCGYNTILVNDETVNASWGDVQAAYQRRSDLIPNLVNTVKAFAEHEKETLTGVIEARSKATAFQLTPETLSNPEAMKQFQQAQGELNSALSRLMVSVERYPDLKANQNFMDLQHQLEGTENRINVARTRYNEAIKTFNISIRTFPNSITNSMFLKLEPKQPFTATAEAQKAPKVEF